MNDKKLKIALLILIFIVAFGTLGFRLIEGMTVLDALFMTIITISTVGYSEVVPLSNAGKVFAIFLIVFGVSTVAYSVGSFINTTLQKYIKDQTFRRNRMERKIAKFREHYIIVGFGRVGKNVAEEFKHSNENFVVIENDPKKISKIQESGFFFVEGDGSDDEILRRAGVKRAKGLVAAVRSDAHNVFIVLSAKRANPSIFIVARANDFESIDKLRAAGANRVVSPSAIGGRRMASLLLRPVVSDYLDLVSHGIKLEYRLEEIELNPSSKIDGVSIKEADIRGKTGALILAVKREDNINTNPHISTILKSGDLLIAMGTHEQLQELEKLA